MNHIEFDEDKTLSKKSIQEDQLPQKGIEGWIYKKIPGSYLVKKIILISFILILFIVSILFIVLAGTEEKTEQKVDFQNRLKATQLK